jgi:diguanylate cyclase (GGDEF)-like protein/PAS domain S-box-containing protein
MNGRADDGPTLADAVGVPRAAYPVGFHRDVRPAAILDNGFRFQEVNTAFVQDLGLGPEDLLGRPLGEVWDLGARGGDALVGTERPDGVVFVDLPPAPGRPHVPPVAIQTWPLLYPADGRRVGTALSLMTADAVGERRQFAIEDRGFRLSFDRINVGMLICGLDGFIIKSNPAMVKIFGRDADDIARTDILTMIHPDYRDEGIRLGLRCLSEEIDSYTRESRFLRGDDTDVWVHETSTIVRGEGGEPLHFISQFIDIDDRKRAEAERDRAEAERNRAAAELSEALAALRESEAKYKFLVEGTPVPLIELDRDLNISTANSALGALLDRDPIGLSVWDIVHPEDLALLTELCGADAPDNDLVVDVRVLTGARRERWVRSHTRVHLDAAGALLSVTATWTDITEARREAEDLRLRASTDSLTGLPNRATALRRLDDLLRAGDDFALLFIDLDGFKAVNDRWGHRTGDELLCRVAQRLLDGVRPGDTVARFGGDEFVVIAEPLGDHARAKMLGDRLVALLAEPFTLAEGTATIGASIGMVRGARDAGAADLLDRADIASYRAKRAGGSRLVLEAG